MPSFIPTERPITPLLDAIESPADLRRLPKTDLPALTEELRQFLLYTVGQTGGHFGAGLGVVELTIALHYVFNTPEDKLVWDVGHQTYPHKILCGRRKQMGTMRQRHGLAPFPSRAESEYDAFGTGHSSTSISAALGMERAAHLTNKQQHHVAIIGDGAMTAGMAFEALNHAGALKSNLLVVLNDNAMSISDNVGALSQFFSRFIAGKTYMTLKQFFKQGFKGVPLVNQFMHQTEEGLKHLFLPPSAFFETLGFNYTGIIDGHDLPELVEVLERLKDADNPQLLHIKTKKGKGYAPAEQDPIGYHALTKIVPVAQKTEKTTEKSAAKPLSYSQVFGHWICDMAEKDPHLVAITPAMREGSGLVEFSERFPDRYYDVGICEQHALTLAAGLACGGMHPVVAIYSTFLQRGYDQLIHDICLQNLPILLAIDRAGLVGEDGSTHNGAYDLSYLGCIPNMTVMTPADENLTYRMLTTGYGMKSPAAVRYPRGAATGAPFVRDNTPVTHGKILRTAGKKTAKKQAERLSPALLVFGSPMREARHLAEKHDWTLVDMRFVKPTDTALLKELLTRHQRLVSIEVNVISGGGGSRVADYLAQNNASADLLMLGIDDKFVEHATQAQMLAACGLDLVGLEKSILKRWPDLA